MQSEKMKLHIYTILELNLAAVMLPVPNALPTNTEAEITNPVLNAWMIIWTFVMIT
jgi:hypothetical protein